MSVNEKPRYGQFTASRAGVKAGEYFGHGETAAEAFKDLSSFTDHGRGSHAEGPITCKGPEGETYSQHRLEDADLTLLEARVASVGEEFSIVDVRKWDAPVSGGKPGRYFAEFIVRDQISKGE